MINDCYPFENIPLPYDYDSLEPHIDSLTMHLHHDKHLQTYIDRLNQALKEHPRLQPLSLEQLIRSAAHQPRHIGVPISQNAGGVYNHRMYFETLTPDSLTQPNTLLANAIDRSFGSFSEFQKQWKEAALGVFGSGYGWLAADRCGRLRIIKTANQDTPLTLGLSPVINIDVWEHAYYLKHYNKRADYIDDWFQVADWTKAGERYASALKRQR